MSLLLLANCPDLSCCPRDALPGEFGPSRRDPTYSSILKNVRYWILHWILSGVALFLVAHILPGIEVDSLGPALIAALVIGLVSATLGVILKILLLPFIILTLGIVYFLINGLMLKLASAMVPGFRVVGCLPAVLGSVLLTIVDYVLNRLVGL
jgi:putative membrane protein